MTTILVIEDQTETIADFRKAAVDGGQSVTLLEPRDVGLNEFKPDPHANKSAEEQLAAALKAIVEEHHLDLVLLDSDLTRDDTLQTHSSYSSAFALIGMPTCRYKKRGSTAKIARYTYLRRTSEEGSSAIWVPGELLGAEVARLPRWLAEIARGMATIQAALDEDGALLDPRRSPIDVLSVVLSRPESPNDFLGYAAKNFSFFGKHADPDQVDMLPQTRVYATRLGYWLFNYIMTFPGPILDAPQACAFLNLDPSMLGVGEVRGLFGSCRYQGPFAEVGDYYWRSDLAELIDDCEGDVARHDALKGISLKRIDDAHPEERSYICMLSGKPVTGDEVVTPDWIPSGATEARFTEDAIDQLGPLAGS